jgi:murein L,D-transpeptidase YafK
MGAGAAHGPSPLPAARIEVWKAKRELRLFSQGRLVERYRIGLGLAPVGHKEKAGDRRTPEGTYRICNKNPHSQYYLSLQISYPSRTDADRALAAGRLTPGQYERIAAADRRGAPPPSNTPLGGDIFIHGRGSSADWTWGCVALDDPDMKELFALVPVGTPVEIRP